MNSILARYSHLPGDQELVFRTLCALLAENPQGADWSEFSSTEWSLFEKMAVDEGVASFAYYLLMQEPHSYKVEDFDPRALATLRDQEGRVALRNAQLFKHLQRVLSTLSRAEIDVVLLKGADLARWVYPQPGLRPMSDLDLLVSPEDFPRALELVQELGYSEYLPEASPGLDKLLGHHAHLRGSGLGRPLLELHYALVASSAFRHAVPLDWFLENLQPLDTDGPGQLYRLNPTSNLVYLSAHQMLQHGGEHGSLIWLLDLHRLLVQNSEDINWQSLATQANLFAWNGALHTALTAVQDCFGTRLSMKILSTLSDQVGPNDALVALKAQQAPTRILGEIKKLHSLNWHGRIHLFLALAFPSPSYMHWRYRPQPGWMWPLYYPLRWVDIIFDGLQTILQIILKRKKKDDIHHLQDVLHG